MKKQLLLLFCCVPIFVFGTPSKQLPTMFSQWWIPELITIVSEYFVAEESQPPPSVDFTFTPDENMCEGTTITFTSDVTDGEGTLDYDWDFGDGSSSTQVNPSHVFNPSNRCGAITYSVSLTVTDENDDADTISYDVIVLPSPDINFHDLDVINQNLAFNNCGSTDPVYAIQLQNQSPSNSCISQYTITWGDGSLDEVVTSFPVGTSIPHVYNGIDVFDMTIVALGDNGCSSTKTYIVKNYTNPSAGFVNPGSTTNLCIPMDPIEFLITNWGENTDDCTYTVDFGDGSAPVVYTQSDLFAFDPSGTLDFPVPYVYSTSSCPSGDTVFRPFLVVINECSSSTVNLNDISVVVNPTLAFDNPPIGCLNEAIVFENNSIAGYDSSCDQGAIYFWDFGDGSPIFQTPYGLPSSVTHTYTSTGTYTVTMYSDNDFCDPTTAITNQICIEEPPLPAFNLNTNEGCFPLSSLATNTTSTTNMCSAISYLWQVSYTAANCGTVSNWGFIGGTNQTSENPQFQFNGAGIYNITLTATNDCGGVTSAAQTVSVKSPPTANIIDIPNYCGATSITPTATIENCTTNASEMTYLWSFPGGSPASSNSADPGAIDYATPGDYTVTLEVTNNCGNIIVTDDFSIFDQPIISSQPLPSQSLCQNAVPESLEVTASVGTGSLSYQWFVNTNNNNTGGTLIPGATNSTYTPPTTTVGILYYYVVVSQVTAPDCNVVSNTSEVEVLTAPTFTVQPVGSSVCENGTANQLVVDYTSGTGTPTYQWYSNTTNTTVGSSPISGATSSTYDPPTTPVGTTYYYCIISFTGGGCSEIISNIALVDVTAAVVVDSQPIPTQDTCIGGTISNILSVTYSGGTGTVSYQWYINTTNTTTGGTPITGATSSTYTPPAAATSGDFYFYVIVTLDGVGCTDATSDVAIIVVLEDPVVGTQPIASQSLCQSAIPVDLEVVASGGIGTFEYQWYSNTTDINTGGTLIPGATSSTYTPPTTTVGILYYYVEISQAPSNLDCNVVSNTSEVEVLTAPTFTVQPVGSSVCENGTANQLVVDYTSGTGTPTYQWYSNTTNTTVGSSPISGATSSTYDPPTTPVGTTYYYCIISFTGGGCSEIISNIALVDVTAAVVVDSQPIPTQDTCIGGTISNILSVTYSGGTGTVSYQWYINTTNTTTGGTIISGATSSTYTPPPSSTSGNFYYYVIVSLDGVGCTDATSDVAIIVVLEDPVVGTQPIVSQSLCQSATPNDLEVVASGGIGTFEYQWYSNTTDINTGGTLIPGATSSTYTPPTTTVGILYYYVEISQAPSNLDCEVISNTSEVEVLTAPEFTIQPVDSSVCENGIPNDLEVAYTNGTGTATYQWYSSTTDNNSGGLLIPGATSSIYTPPTDTVVTLYYYCEISFSTGGCTEIYSDTALVEVTAAVAIDSQPIPTQETCIGGAISNILSVTFSGGTGAVNYQWYINTTSTNSGGTPITGATSSSYTPPASTTSGSFYYYVVVTLDGVGCTGATSDVAIIVVLEDPVVGTQPIASQSLCQSAIPVDLEVVAAGGIGSFEYQWFVNTTNTNVGGTLIPSATNASFTPPTGVVGTFYYYVEVSQSPSNLDCFVVSNASEVIITSAPTFTLQPIPSTICENEMATELIVIYINGTGTPTYQWYENNIDSNSGGNAISGATSSNFNPPTNTVGTIYYYCVITFTSGGCSEIYSDTAAVIVNQTPVIANYSDEVCSSLLFEFDPSTVVGNIVPSGTTYTWTLPNISPVGSISGATEATSPQAIFSQTLTNLTTSVAVVTYTVTPTSGICVGIPFDISITVNPGISVSVIINDSNCYQDDNGSIDAIISGGTPISPGNPYIINWMGPNGFTSNSPLISNLEPGTYSLSVEDNSSCTFNMAYEVSEPNELILTTDAVNDISCFGFDDGEILISVSGGTLPYTYLWTTSDGSGLIPSDEDQSNLSEGTYDVEITDANNCIVTGQYQIIEPTELLISEVHNLLLCFGDSNGTITVNIDQSSIPDYTYTISGIDYLGNPFSTTQTQPGISFTVNNLLAGMYNVIVTDLNGCEKIINAIEILQPTDIVVDVTKVDIMCFSDSNGSITLNVSGGSPSYTYLWSDLGSGPVRTNLSAGIYTVTVTDQNDCFKTLDIEILGPEFHIEPDVRNISCFGEDDGYINLNIFGGVSPITVTWDDDATAGVERNNLSPGTYTVLVTDSDSPSCPINQTFIITEPNPIISSGVIVNALDCDIVNSGSINLQVTGGTLPLSFLWNNGATTEDLTNIPPGDYSVVITDANGCEDINTFTVFRPPPIAIDLSTNVIANCETRETVQRNTLTVTGGIPPYTTVWSRGDVDINSPMVMTTDENGVVIVDVIDSYGCTQQLAFDVAFEKIGIASFEMTSFGFEEYGSFSIDDPIFFTNTSSENPIEVEWNFGDRSETSSIFSPEHTYTNVGSYAVTLTVQYAYGCSYSVTKNIVITQGYDIILPTAFTPNQDGINDTARPTYFGLISMEMSVFNTWGQVVYYEEGLGLSGWDGSIKGEEAENGNYVLAIKGVTFYGEEITSNGAITLIR